MEAGVKRWIVAGTYAEYGRSAERYDLIPVDAPLEPTFPYAASKAAFFPIVHALAVQQNAELAYFRIFSIFGEGQHQSNFWPSLRDAALGGRDFPMTPGDQVRDFLEVEKAASALLLSVSNPAILPGQPWIKNLASGVPVTVGDFGAAWWERLNVGGKFLRGALPYRENEVMRYVPEVDPSIFKSPGEFSP
jgi:nucleoside-diphosphate-sugar epimerase